ncbi:MAG TPA: hypothetical protein VMQ48_01150 [Candidatus Saccharimonadales bacterium]|nr:hypothetical protein [Candidatus Saccharimonadales bacterium]
MIIGVGFLLFSIVDGIPKLFVLRELKSKPEIYKKEGMLSFPLETYQEIDGNYTNTIIRLLKEEIGISLEQASIGKIISKKFSLIPGRSDIVTVYGYGFFHGNPAAYLCPSDDDITFAGWYTCEDLLNYPLIRVETAPILRHFLKKHAREILG